MVENASVRVGAALATTPGALRPDRAIDVVGQRRELRDVVDVTVGGGFGFACPSAGTSVV